MLGYDSHDTSVAIDNRQPTEMMLQHELGRVHNRGIGRNGLHPRTHKISNLHPSTPQRLSFVSSPNVMRTRTHAGMAHHHLQLVNPDRDFLEADRASGDLADYSHRRSNCGPPRGPPG